jgi:putative DNA primase/helicase
MSHDLAEVKRNADIVSIVERYVALRKEGNEYLGLCPFHTEDTPSFKVNHKKQIYKCFGCGEGGDVVDFVVKVENCNVPKALEFIVTGQASGTFEKKAAPQKPVKNWRQLLPGEDAPRPNFKHYRHGIPVKYWEYRTQDGTPIGYACRFDLQDGQKEVLPLVYATDGAKTEWRWKGFEAPRPVLNQDILAMHGESTVILVEGEKTAEAVQRQFKPDEYVVTTWPGGGNAVALVDWTPLKGRKVIFWPDNDCQGLSAMLHIFHLAGQDLASARFVPLDATLPKGWDGADKRWKKGEVQEFFNSRVVDAIPANLDTVPDYLREKYGNPVQAYRFTQVQSESVYIFGLFDKLEGWQFTKIIEEQEEAPEPVLPALPPPPPASNEPPYFPPFSDDEGGIEDDGNAPFSVLGFEKVDTGKVAYCFFDRKKKVMIRKSVESLNKSAMLEIADLSYWENHFPKQGRRGGIDEDLAKNWIIREASKKGLFSGRSIRGRGAWMDSKRVVLHAGTHLIVNGKTTELSKIESRYMYEISDPLEINVENPISKHQASKLIDLLKVLPWERELNPLLLAGWCVVAPMCGALRWRPHIWITGGAGTGKSWIMRNVVRELLGQTALAVQGETSEAGLRQTLGMDALPVVFDEAEPTDPDANKRIQQVIALMRSASTNDSGDILKGTAGHAAKSFKIRSCFAMASISVPVDKQSDRSRVTILGLSNRHKTTLEELNKMRLEIINEEFVRGFHARTINMLPTILENAAIFAAAAASVLGEQRVGDQIGAMLAGAFSLTSDRVISLEEAIEWIQKHNWDEEQAAQERDEVNLLSHLMQQAVRVDTGVAVCDRTIGELVAIAHKSMDDPSGDVTADVADQKLRRIGFKIDGDALVISNSADAIKRMLRETPWSRNHNKVLMRLEGAQAMESTRFGPGLQSRAVMIPVNKHVL